MSQFLKVRQIYFSPEQAPMLEPEYEPYYNERCTPYFEAAVIRDLVLAGDHKQSEYYGVVSYQLRHKIGAVMKERWASVPHIANHSLREFTPALFEAELERHRPDVMSFQRHMPHDTVAVAERYHPGFRNHWERVMQAIGYDWQPKHFENVFYSNYFAARSDLYEDFVREMLAPAMDVMAGMPELWGNSRYPKALPGHLAAEWGVNWYPFHSFLCERMFSYWADLKRLKCLHY